MGQTAKLFTNGGSQAVRLPAEFRFEGTEVNIRKDPVTGEVILSGQLDRQTARDAFFQLRDEMLANGEIPEDFLVDRDQGDHRPDSFYEWAEEDLK